MELFQIKSIDDYLDYFMEQTNTRFFVVFFPRLKEKILQNCTNIRTLIEEINQENFFDQLSKINNLEAEISILLEFSEYRELDIINSFTEEEILDIAQSDCKTYFKEKCGLDLMNPTPHSIHFSVC